MDELAHRMVVARENLREEALPGEAWLEGAAAEFRRRRERRVRLRRLRWAAVGVVAALGIGAGAERWREAVVLEKMAHLSPPAFQRDAAVSFRSPAPVRLADGSVAIPLDDLTVMRTDDSSPTRSVVELVRGGARFSVARRPAHSLRIEAGPASIDVAGTEFTVERIASQVRVAVFSGELHVLCQGQVVQLVEGETAMFPRAQAWQAPDPDFAAAMVDSDEPGPDLAARTLVHGAPSSPDALLATADAARRAHQPARAVAPLRKMVASYRHDPRTPAAAFTLGRVLMDLGEPRQAAAAFIKAASLDIGGSLAEDALAREVEAWSGAGDGARARARALDYVRRYPQGARLVAMQKHAASGDGQ